MMSAVVLLYHHCSPNTLYILYPLLWKYLLIRYFCSHLMKCTIRFRWFLTPGPYTFYQAQSIACSAQREFCWDFLYDLDEESTNTAEVASLICLLGGFFGFFFFLAGVILVFHVWNLQWLCTGHCNWIIVIQQCYWGENILCSET